MRVSGKVAGDLPQESDDAFMVLAMALDELGADIAMRPETFGDPLPAVPRKARGAFVVRGRRSLIKRAESFVSPARSLGALRVDLVHPDADFASQVAGQGQLRIRGIELRLLLLDHL